MRVNTIRYPYIPMDRTIKYVPKDNTFMLQAREVARQFSCDKIMPVGAVVVKDGEIIGIGANTSKYHHKHGCNRIKLGLGSGQGYELCEGCNPKYHSEPAAIADAIKNGFPVQGADIYIWGGWFCCEGCWNAIIQVGIQDVYFMENSEKLFCKEHPDNIIGKQFLV